MAGRNGSTDLGLMMFFMLMAMSYLFGIVDAEEPSPSLLQGNSSPAIESSPKLGKMSFDENWKSDAPMTCTCNCYPAPEAPPKAPSQQSPVGRTRSPPPSPVYESPSPPAGSTKSPVTFTSPHPPAPYGDAPRYAQPAPAPETLVPSPPPPPTY